MRVSPTALIVANLLCAAPALAQQPDYPGYPTPNYYSGSNSFGYSDGNTGSVLNLDIRPNGNVGDNVGTGGLGAGEVYNFAEVRSHQFVETWSSVRLDALHVRVHVANQRGGLAGAMGGAFTPIVTLSFRDPQGKELAHFTLNLIATGKVADSEVDFRGGAVLWGTSTQIVATAAEGHYREPPPPTYQIYPLPTLPKLDQFPRASPSVLRL